MFGRRLQEPAGRPVGLRQHIGESGWVNTSSTRFGGGTNDLGGVDVGKQEDRVTHRPRPAWTSSTVRHGIAQEGSWSAPIFVVVVITTE